MKVLVTGATGLLGSHLTDMLAARGGVPRALVRPGESPGSISGSRVELSWGDMNDAASLKAAVDGIDCVLHCAARTGPWGDIAEYERTNVQGLRRLVEVAIAAGVRRLVHVSSISVHGNDIQGSADETAPLRAEPNPYSRTKVAGERLLEEMIRKQSAPVTIVRPGWIYGPRDSASFGRFAAMIERGRMVLMGAGSNHIPLVYVEDVARGILLAAEADGAAGRSYLLVNDEPVTQRDYFGAIAAALNVPAPTRSLPYGLALTLATVAETAGRVTGMRKAPPLTRFGVKLIGGENRFSIARARSELGFVPRIMLEEGVRRSVEWYRTAGLPTVAEPQPA